MAVNARWVMIGGELMLSITLPHNQHVTIDRETGWILLVYLRAAMHEKPGDAPDTDRYGN
ncbi:MAG TPA: hypothetical protein VND65_07570 [Candidatus Binatia bacterium]|nr:hypothetical protein [Candidatus Binatia bacterium]